MTISVKEAHQIIEGSQLVATLRQENAELKAKLENAICPKYEIKQKVYFTCEDDNNEWFVREGIIYQLKFWFNQISYMIEYAPFGIYPIGVPERFCFTTKAEALASLEVAQAGGK